MKINDRIEYIDVARGIAIILMIMGHVLSPGSLKRNFIFSFDMPLFVVISGYFFSNSLTIKRIIHNSFFKMYLPTCITMMLVEVINLLLGRSENIRFIITLSLKKILLFMSFNKENGKINEGYPYNTGVLWFIAFLICIRIVYFFIVKISDNNVLYTNLLCLILSIVGFYISEIRNVFLPWSLDVALFCLPFFSLGNILKMNNQYLERCIFNDYKILITLFAVWIFTTYEFSCIELAIRRYPYGFTVFISAISGVIFVLAFSFHFWKKFKAVSNLLMWIGKNSFYVLLGHHIESCLINYGIIAVIEKSKELLFISKTVNSLIIAFVISCFINSIIPCFRCYQNKTNGGKCYEKE